MLASVALSHSPMSTPPDKNKKRRAKGEGSIFHRPDLGYWVAQVDLGKNDLGNRVRRTIYGKSRAEVLRNVADLKARHGGSIRPRVQGTVGAWIERWLRDDVKPNLAANTYVYYSAMWRNHAQPIISHIPMEKFGIEHVEQLYVKLREEGASSAILDKVARTLSRALEVAIRRQVYNAANPFRLVDKPRHHTKETLALNADDAQRFVEAARGDRYEALWLALITTGLRIGEALGLEWRDINFENGTLAIRQGVTEISGTTQVGPLKTKSSRRSIEVGPILLDALQRRHEAAQAEGHRSPFVFTTRVGTHPSRSPLRQRHFAPVCTAAGITGLTFHGLRHTMGSLLAAERVGVKVVAERMGHSQTSTTLDKYTHMMPGLQREAADTIEAIVAPKTALRHKAKR